MRLKGLFILLAATLCAAPAGAQVVIETSPQPAGRVEGIRPDGLIFELGVADPAHGDRGMLWGVNAGMGTFVSRHLNLSLGLRHWSADIDRSDFGADTPGTFNDTAIDATLAYPLMSIKGLRPYLGGGMAVHKVGADVPGDRSLEDALSGLNIGALAVLGVGTTRPGLGFRVQARRDFVEDVGAWTYAVGAGWWPKTRANAARRTIQYGTPAMGANEVTYLPSATPPTAPATAPATALPPPVDRSGDETKTALNHLKAENEALAADLAKIREQLATPATPAPTPVPPPAAEPAPRVEVAPDRSTMLFDALARVSALAGYPDNLRRQGDSGLLTLDQSLLFATGQSQLTTGAREELRRIAVVLLRFPEARVVVQGHTDAVGKATANQLLSERRAAAVRQELLAIGIDPAGVAAVGYGDTRPVAGNDTSAGRARNRRVDLYITMPETGSGQSRSY